MNSLSWMIYGADVADSISHALTTGSILSGVGLLITTAVAATLKLGGPDIYSRDDADAQRAKHAKWDANAVLAVTVWKRLAVACASFALVASVIPSSKAIYAIAASEVGEQMLKSATVTKAQKALDAWLDRQIAPAKEPAR